VKVKETVSDEARDDRWGVCSVVVSALSLINEVNQTSGPVSTEMGDRVRVQFPVPDICFGM